MIPIISILKFNEHFLLFSSLTFILYLTNNSFHLERLFLFNSVMLFSPDSLYSFEDTFPILSTPFFSFIN